MEVFIHHIYEYQKGIRNLILHTTEKENIDFIKNGSVTTNGWFLTRNSV